jgi:hypothetical protein
MNQTINEPIEVAGVYKNHHFKPVKFLWRSKTYQVEQITLISELKDGNVRRRLYSIICKGNLYRLLFDRDAESWKLEEIWCE